MKATTGIKWGFLVLGILLLLSTGYFLLFYFRHRYNYPPIPDNYHLLMRSSISLMSGLSSILYAVFQNKGKRWKLLIEGVPITAGIAVWAVVCYKANAYEIYLYDWLTAAGLVLFLVCALIWRIWCYAADMKKEKKKNQETES